MATSATAASTDDGMSTGANGKQPVNDELEDGKPPTFQGQHHALDDGNTAVDYPVHNEQELGAVSNEKQFTADNGKPFAVENNGK